jgi:hypothetical protein
MPDKKIKNEQWYVKDLVYMVAKKEIFKPKVQRKRRWYVLPQKGKDKTPSEKEYITFLFKTNNSVHAITFGNSNMSLSNIDGNNRINAIVHFLEEPFKLFPEKLDEIFSYIDTILVDELVDIINSVKEVLKKIKYRDLMTFKYNKYFIENGFKDLYDKNLKKIRDEMEPYFDNLITSMKINGKERFDTDVKININIFEGYTAEELAKVFVDINKYYSGLTEQEILASRLFVIHDFTINNEVIRVEIINSIKEFYINRAKDEALLCYTFNEQTDRINAYDFMVGFQNYIHEKNNLISIADNDGLSLFFKIYKTIFKGNFEDTFTTENINEFIDNIMKAVNVLDKLKDRIFMEDLVSSYNTFDGCNKKLNSLKKNNTYLIMCAVIGYNKKNIPEQTILNSIEKCLVFHFLSNDVKNKDKREIFKINDSILYEAGGAFIDGKSKEYYKDPHLISEKITRELMSEIMNQLILENINNIPYQVRSNGKDKNDKRRVRKMHEKFLIYYYYRMKVPYEYLNFKYWIEHIFPFSSSWEGNIDIDRLGNIFPIIDKLNIKRSNKHISEYDKHDKWGLMKFIEAIPNENDYNNTITHENKKPHIKNSDKYNEICSSNEKKIVEMFLNTLFQ